GVAERAKILGWIEAKGGRVAPRPDQPTIEARAVRLRAVLQHLHAVLARAVVDGRHVRGVAVEVYDHHRSRSGRYAPIDFGWVERMRARVNLAEDWVGARGDDGRDWRDAGVGGNQHLVIRLDTQGKQANPQRVGSRAQSDRLLAIAVIRREFVLEALQLGTH